MTTPNQPTQEPPMSEALEACARGMFSTLYGPGIWGKNDPAPARSFTYAEWINAFAAGLAALPVTDAMVDSGMIALSHMYISPEEIRAALTAAIRHLTAGEGVMAAVPAIGDMLAPRDGGYPGLVVAVLPSGAECVIAGRYPPTYEVRERVYATNDLKGPMTGKMVQPCQG